MFAIRRVVTGLFVADVVLFLVAGAFNDHSSTSADGILWWVAIAGFLLLMLSGVGVIVQFLRTRRWRPRRARARSRT